MLIFEESSAVIPHWPHGMRPSSNKQVADAVKLCRKDHVKILLIFQNKKQVDKRSWKPVPGKRSSGA